ncbi:MAG: Lrp/AsnC ligand binding domain-containing protein [Thermoplasmata archaeon]|nr:MAG: Lrp/AsnC ligand binding domain-containing protein [Thermoplasmata archaeon]
MAVCYILIRTQPGMETKVFQGLKKIQGIDEAHILFGDYDIISKLELPDFDEIADNIIDRIRKIDGVLDTRSFPCTQF